jgi:rhodanese-related sulfurtransferase
LGAGPQFQPLFVAFQHASKITKKTGEYSMASFNEILGQVKQTIREVSVDETRARTKGEGGAPPVLIDVRERDEYEQGFIPQAQWVPRGFLELKVEDMVPERDREVILYCAGGTRSALAARSLRELGYTNVASLAGGFRAWKNAGLGVRSTA